MGRVTRRWGRQILGLLVTAVFLWLLVYQLDLSELGAAMVSVSLPALFIALLFLAAGYATRIFRWWWMLRILTPKLPFRACGWPFLASFAVNNVLPFRAGDALRVFGFGKQLDTAAPRVLGTVVIERLLDLLTVLGFVFIGLIGVDHDQFPPGVLSATAWLAVMALLMVLLLLFFLTPLQKIAQWLAGLATCVERGWSPHIVRLSNPLFESLGLLKKPGLALQLVVLSVGVWALEGAVFVSVAYALGTTDSLLGPCLALGMGNLATLLPSSPGGLGTFDYFAMLGLLAYGADRETATAFALTVHITLWIPVTVVGLAYFVKPRA